MKQVSWALAGCLVTTLLGTASAAGKPDPAGVAFFESKIRPVLVKHCYQCHSSDSEKPKGGLLLDTKAGTLKGGETGHAVVPGNLKESLLIAAIKHTGDVSEMPPKQKLPDHVIADFEKWVKMGAPDPRDGKKLTGPRKIDIEAGRKFWAFVPPTKSLPPAVKNSAWPRNDIDRFLLAKLESKSMKPVQDAGKISLIRRATYDLTGLPPKPEAVEAFIRDTSPNAFEKVIDRLLASKQFGERWGRHWLDVVRYAESTGKERNYVYPYAWRYRNYVIDSFNADKPYDQFVREQIAGDLLPAKSAKESNDQVIATGLLAMGPKSLNERNRLKFEMDVVDDQIDVAGRAFLATTIACARCHDHKFDPIPTKDYYALAGIFRSTDVKAGVRGQRGVRNGGSGALISLKSASANGVDYDKHREKLQELRTELRKAQTRLARLNGEPAPKGKKAAKKKKNAKKKKQNKKQLAAASANLMKMPVIDKNDRPAVVKLKTEVRKMITEVKALVKNAPAAPAVAMGVQESGKAIDSKVFIKGEVTDQGETVKRGFLTVASRSANPKLPANQSGRLQLAYWMTARENPLTARVMANRIWHHLFGTGLVKTVDNFGELGERPTHPELLDYLAVRFMENGWSTKKLIKDVMMSRAYQLDTDHHESNYVADPENRLHWRFSRRRLDAESIRDSILAVAGKLDLERPETSPVQDLNGELGRQLNPNSIRLGENIRSVYIPVIRQAMPQMLTVFDVADPSLVVGQRDVTTVPTQALFMMNSPFVLRHAEAMAQRLFNEKGMSDADRIELAYKLTLSRAPKKEEADRVQKFISEYRSMLGKGAKAGSDRELEGWAAFCQTLLASAEFRYLY